MTTLGLNEYGWNPSHSAHFEPHAARGLAPGRVIADLGTALRLAGDDGIVEATAAGRLLRDGERPAIGDWVAYRPTGGAGGPALIEAVLPRRTKLARKVSGGRTAEQVVAANVDLVVVVMGLDDDFSVRRMERFLVMAWDGGARPLVLLNKADLAADPAARAAEAGDAAPGVPVVVASCRNGTGVDDLVPHLVPGETVVLVGSSGVGKSTLINHLLGREVQETRDVRASDGRGQHTTTHRELFRLPGGALLVDNPGVRELAPWAGDEALAEVFDDVEALAAACRFRDCGHRLEPGCAVRDAVEEGRLGRDRLEAFHGLQRELAYLTQKQDVGAAQAEKRRWREVQLSLRRNPKHR